MTTIFTCVIMTIGSIMFSSDTEKIIIAPITKMVGIIRMLADDPLKKREEPIFTLEEENFKAKNQLKTVELQKTIYRLSKLIQMSYGELGSKIIRENWQGDGSLDIMIPGHKLSVIFCIVQLEHFVFVTEVMQEESIQFINQIVGILHQCAKRWDGWANKSEGDKFILSWTLPEVDENDNEKNEQLLEQRTELADKSLITAVKIVSEMRRATQINAFYKKPQIYANPKLGNNSRPHLTFALHMGWTIEGAIGSDSKIDACYMSPQLQYSYKLQNLCEYYDQQILVSEKLYNMMSLKARNTLRKIDVIKMKED